MSLAKALRAKPIVRIKGAVAAELVDDAVAVEEPLEIRVNGRSVAVVMRTPGHDRELAAGFLVTEGIVRNRDDVIDLVRCDARGTRPSSIAPDADATGSGRRPAEGDENILDALLAPGAAVDLERLTRHVFTSSSCGVCSKATIEAVRTKFPAIAEPFAPKREVLLALPAQMRAAQPGFDATGGVHACALFDGRGERIALREDVGRHNAVDKVLGHAFFAERLPLAGCVLLVSGRVSFEIVQKALAAGIPCLAAISAPTTAAIELARASGQTLIGFLRGDGMNVYSGTLAE